MANFKRKLTLVLVLSIILLWACDKNNDDTIAETTVNNGPTTETTTGNSSGTSDKKVAASVNTPNSDDHESADDYVWESSSVIDITLEGESIATPSDAVSIAGSVATITRAGNYRVSGSLTNGQLIVNTTDEATVRIILNNATMACATSAPISVEAADKVVLVLADNTQNTITDGSAYVFASADVDEPNAAIYSKADMTILGQGALTVNANYNDAIASTDGLIIKSGNINITATDDGIRGKDYLIVKSGTLNITSADDGLKSDNSDDLTKGYITIEQGTIKITSGGDAISAQKNVTIASGVFNLTSGGGSSKTITSTTASAKGINAEVLATINGGTFTISSADDAIHSNNSMVINSGTIAIASGDDGLHADSVLTINGGEISVSKSHEGIESIVITITGGVTRITASDDGINAAGIMSHLGPPGQQVVVSPSGKANFFYMKGGHVSVNANGDGVDVNGYAEMTNGTLLVNGPNTQDNGPIDYDGTFTISGGMLVAVGSSGMAQIPGTSSSQASVLFTFSSKTANTLFHVQASDGTNVLTFVPIKSYQSVAFSAPALTSGATYDVYTGGSSTGTVTDGLYTGGTYTGGTKVKTVTLSGVASKVSL